MTKDSLKGLDRFALRRVERLWAHAKREVAGYSLGQLKALISLARMQRRGVDAFLYSAEARIAPMKRRPVNARPGTDWVWRPDLWSAQSRAANLASLAQRTELVTGVTLFHDCPEALISSRQIVGTSIEEGAAYALSLEVFHFEGSFLSLAFDLPPEAVQGLRTRHLIGLEVGLECERPLEAFARLNVKHGPNVEQIVRELPRQGEVRAVEFDMFYTELNEKRVEQAWVDLIFQRPHHNQIVLRDVTMTRRPRAEV